MDRLSLFSSKTICNKTIIRFSFCDIRNNQGLGKCYQPSASADNTYLDLDFLDITKTSSNNCLLINKARVLFLHCNSQFMY